MKLEVGKKYVLKSGQVVGPLYDDGDGIFVCGDSVGNFFPMWKKMVKLTSLLIQKTTILNTMFLVNMWS
jgi:hypothetical protein